MYFFITRDTFNCQEGNEFIDFQNEKKVRKDMYMYITYKDFHYRYQLTLLKMSI
jgi:hypothetical protein